MPLRALLLDFGGTLAAERRSRAAMYARVGRARGLDVDDAAMQAAMGAAHAALPEELEGAYRYSDPWFRAFIAHVFQGTFSLPAEHLRDVEAELFAAFSDARNFTVFPDVRPLLERARSAGLRVGVVSNWGERLAPLLAGLELTCDVALASALEGCEKPDPALFRRALDRLGAAASAALHVGDRLDNDVDGARGAGIEAVWLDRSGRMTGPPGVRVIRSLDELELRT